MSEIKRVQFTTISTHTSHNSIAGIGGGGAGGLSTGTGIVNPISTGGSKFTEILQNQQIKETEASLGFSSGTSGNKSVNNNNSNNNDNGSNNTATLGGKSNKTFRYELELFEPDSKIFPEFNFSKMMHIEKKKQKKLKQIQANGVSDPFEENDDDVARIAKEMEMKYGKSYVSGRRKTKYDDLCDKGLGYDESDSFIDNTEAYDELIPDEVETIAGGFYINSGQLEFTKLTKYEIETEEIVKMVKSKKRILSSSSEESEDDEEGEENELIDLNAEIDTDDKASKKRKEMQEEKFKSSHRDKKQKSSGEDSSSSKSKVKTKKLKDELIVKDCNSKSGDDGTNSDNGKEKPALKTTTIKDMLKAKRDNYLKMQDDKKSLQNGIVKSGNDSSESTGDDSDSDTGPSKKKYKTADEEDPEKLRNSDTKLPDNLSVELLTDINELIETAKSAIKSGKKFRFDQKTSEIFLRCDDNATCLEKDIRNQIFAHLEYQMQLPKYYLIKKPKQIRIKQEKSKIKKAYVKLKNAIAKVMPSVINSYEATCKQIADSRSKVTSPELEKSDLSLKYSKKKFPWNDAMRNLLYDLYQTRWTSYTVLRTRKEKFEDFVNSYLREKVVPIWPIGWMKLEDLQKELEKRKNQSKKAKDLKKLTPSNSSNSTDLVNLPGTNTFIDAPKESLTLTTTSITPAKLQSGDGLTTTTNQMSHLSSVKISTSPAAHSKPNYVNEVPQKLPENSISIIPVVQQESTSSKSQKSLNVFNNNNNISIDKVPSSNSSNDSNSKVDNLNNSSSKQSSITVDIVSPTKRTDHSISSIISNTSPTALATSTNVTAVTETTTNRSSSSVTSTTHVINVDDFKNTSDIIQTSNKILNNNNNIISNNNSSSSNNNNNDNKQNKSNDENKTKRNSSNGNNKNNNEKSSSNNSNSNNRKKESKKKGRDRDNLKSKAGSSEHKSGVVVIADDHISNRRDTVESIGSSSDSVEFIDEKLPVSSSSISADKKIVTVNKNKYIKIKTEYNKSRSASPVTYPSKIITNTDNIIVSGAGGGGGSTVGPPPPPSVLQSSRLIPPLLSGANENDNLMMRNMNSNSNFSKNNFTETAEAMSRSDNETNSDSGRENKNSDLDVKQLIEQIKDLGEMNQSNIEVKKIQKDLKNQ